MDESEQLETLKRWWDQYGLYLVTGLVVGIGGFFGWQGWQEYQTRQAERASLLYEQYLDLRETVAREDGEIPPELAAVLDDLDSDYRGTSYQTFSLYHRARDAAVAGDYETAAALLREAVETARSSHLRDVARIRLARVEHALGQSQQALETLRAVQGSGFRALVAEITGDILLSNEDREGARAAYEQALALSEDGPRGILEVKLADLAEL